MKRSDSQRNCEGGATILASGKQTKLKKTKTNICFEKTTKSTYVQRIGQ